MGFHAQFGKIERRFWIITLCTVLSVFFIRSLDLSDNKWYVSDVDCAVSEN